MNGKNFRPLHRIADAVFLKPWMISRAFHETVMGPQLFAAMEGKSPVVAYDDGPAAPTPEQMEAAQNAKLIAAAGADEWAVNDKNRRTWYVPYNMDKKSKVGQIVVHGIIGKGLDSFDMDCGGVDVDHVLQALEHLGELGAKAVAMHYNTPGGTVTGVPEAAEQIREFAEQVAPVHAYTDTLCASAGYYLASAADSFTVAPSADIGSIGVYCAVVDSSRYYKEMGIDIELMASGWAKGQGMRGVPVSQEYKDSVRADVMRHAERFWSHVAGRRGEQIERESAALTARSGTEVSAAQWAMNIMQGQCWTAADAPAALHDGLLRSRRDHVAAVIRGLTR